MEKKIMILQNHEIGTIIKKTKCIGSLLNIIYA
jgi:hypothetical protein